MEAGNERLFRVLGDVGGDLVATAERKVFGRSAWQKWLPAAACLVLVVGLGYFALPYLTTGTESCPAAQPETAVIQEPSSTETDSIVTEMEVPKKDSTGWILPKEQIVFWDTIYYVEATYTAEQAVQVVDGYLGTVTSADDETLVGAEVFLRKGSETRTDGKEREVPLEIFVYNGEDYLYCLTYYDTDKSLLEWLAVQTQWYYGRLDTLVETFVAPMELSLYSKTMALNYTDESVLSADQLLHFFLVSLEMERAAGKRTEDLDQYLWYDGEGYVIPVDDIKRQLDKYLEGYNWQPENCSNYNAGTNTVELETLEVELDSDYQVSQGMYLNIAPEHCSLDEENRKLALVVQRYEGQELLDERFYLIRFDEDKCIFESIFTIEEE